MPAADNPLTTLLENIKANLEDSTNHANLATAFKNKTKVYPVFGPWFTATPACVITPGLSLRSGEEGRKDLQQVDLHIIHAVLSAPEHYYSVLGTSSLEGILTLAEEIEKALNRPEPYTYSPYNAAPYTALNNVRGAYVLERGPVEIIELPLVQDKIFVKQIVKMEYTIEKGI